MAATDAQIAAFNLVAEWCTWTLTAETAAIGVIGVLLVTKEIRATTRSFRRCVIATVACFAVSIVLATLIMSSLPEGINEIKQETDSVWHSSVYVFETKVGTVLCLANFHGLFFVLGVLAFTWGIIDRLKSTNTQL
jgi:hypothetical protein